MIRFDTVNHQFKPKSKDMSNMQIVKICEYYAKNLLQGRHLPNAVLMTVLNDLQA